MACDDEKCKNCDQKEKCGIIQKGAELILIMAEAMGVEVSAEEAIEWSINAYFATFKKETGSSPVEHPKPKFNGSTLSEG
jgi:hypothetical protein